MIFTFVNGRSVRDRMLIRAIEQAYQTLIPRGRYPATLLFVDMRPEEVDVNVHPMKTEVRFRNGGAVFEAVYHAIRDRLADQTAIGADAGVRRCRSVPTDAAMGLQTPRRRCAGARATGTRTRRAAALGLGAPGLGWNSMRPPRSPRLRASAHHGLTDDLAERSRRSGGK